jgi:hypothetical protein
LLIIGASLASRPGADNWEEMDRRSQLRSIVEISACWKMPAS